MASKSRTWEIWWLHQVVLTAASSELSMDSLWILNSWVSPIDHNLILEVANSQVWTTTIIPCEIKFKVMISITWVTLSTISPPNSTIQFRTTLWMINGLWHSEILTWVISPTLDILLIMNQIRLLLFWPIANEEWTNTPINATSSSTIASTSQR